MRGYAVRHATDGRSLVLVCPGWVRTDMGGPDGVLDVETSCRGVADMLASVADKPGLHYLDYHGNTVPW
jgi:hypothetical protein